MREDMHTEFKRIWSESAKKAIVAFANTGGGRLYVGVDDDGVPCCLPNADAAIVQVVNAITDGIRPDMGMFFTASTQRMGNADVVVVDVQRGAGRPYYLTEKGIRPSGVYVRQGASSVPASEAEILAMIKESAGDSFEDARSLGQELTFRDAKRAFEDASVAWHEAAMRTLGLVDADGLFTNVAYLLSDQCQLGIKAAVFQGESKLTFRTRREFSGSLFRQFHDVAEFIDLYNETRSTIGPDFKRIDTRSYPVQAIREALLNLIVHRDYSFTGPALISMFDSRMEFVNLGGLPSGLTQADMMMGVSQQRNPKLAQVFYRLGLIEAYGTGVPKMMESYAGVANVPQFEMSDNAFKVTLFSLNARLDDGAPHAAAESTHEMARASESGSKTSARESTARSFDDLSLSGKEKRALKLAESEGGLTRAMLQADLGIAQSTAAKVVKRLVGLGLLKSTEAGRNTRYYLT